MKILFAILGFAAFFLMLGTIGGMELGTMPMGKGVIVVTLSGAVMYLCAICGELVGGRK